MHDYHSGSDTVDNPSGRIDGNRPERVDVRPAMTDYAIVPRRRKYLVVETDERGANALVERYADGKAALDRLRVLKHLSGQLYLYGAIIALCAL